MRWLAWLKKRRALLFLDTAAYYLGGMACFSRLVVTDRPTAVIITMTGLVVFYIALAVRLDILMMEDD